MAMTVKPPAEAREVFESLKSCADNMRSVTYKELGDAVGLPAIASGAPLGYVWDQICIPRKLPLLNAIAVQTDGRRPGESFLPEGPKTDMDDELFWRGVVLQVLGRLRNATLREADAQFLRKGAKKT
ncbi:MAG: hypothetical protein A2139_06460 [Desulfobacca sp. RBG_16_60_12]|nr:MAG: hypothetical protein A2139_06460 [Desulfobacca sp. RBG_16_60_12]